MQIKFVFPIVAAVFSLGAMACSGGSEGVYGEGELADGEAYDGEVSETVEVLNGEIVDGEYIAFDEASEVEELGSLGQAFVPTTCAGTPPNVDTLTVNSATASDTFTTAATYGIPSCPNVARLTLDHFGVSAGVTAGYDPTSTANLPTNQTDCQKIEVSRVTMQNANGTVVLSRTRSFGFWTGTTCIRPVTSSPGTVSSGQHFEWVQALNQNGVTKKVRVTLTRVP